MLVRNLSNILVKRTLKFKLEYFLNWNLIRSYNFSRVRGTDNSKSTFKLKLDLKVEKETDRTSNKISKKPSLNL